MAAALALPGNSYRGAATTMQPQLADDLDERRNGGIS
jgi:hypothetical protein